MKPWKVASLKTRSAANRRASSRRAAALMVVLAWWLAVVACSRNLAPQSQMNATLQAAPTQTSAIPTQTVSAAPEIGATADGGQANPQPAAPAREPTSTAGPLGPNPTSRVTQEPPILYYTQAGDTLNAVAARFNVQPKEINSPEKIKTEGLFDPGVLLLIPPRLGETSSSTPLIPDSEVIYSPSALDFDIKEFSLEAGGMLAKDYREWRSNGWYDGPGVIQRV
ncbi:MAG: hypothetical protein EHM21_11910, partial [Chloroflexi bacterium]